MKKGGQSATPLPVYIY